MEIDLQQWLMDMERRLGAKIDRVDEKVTGHETRIAIVENTRRTVRWLVGFVVAGVVAFLGNFALTTLR